MNNNTSKEIGAPNLAINTAISRTKSFMHGVFLKIVSLCSAIVSYFIVKHMGYGIIVLLAIPIFVGYKLPEWYMKRGYKLQVLEWLSWSNIFSAWIFPPLGVFTGVCSIRFSKYSENKRSLYNVLGGIGLVCAIWNASLGVINYNKGPSSLEVNTTVLTSDKISQQDRSYVASTVVQIFCATDEESAPTHGGSGIIVEDNGLILTNSHIIPQNHINLNLHESGCLVMLPDPKTGKPESIFWAHPIVLNNISEKYDLAFLGIYATATLPENDSEEFGVSHKLPEKFPSIKPLDKCRIEDIHLGDKIRVYGYPSISAGLSLTVTEGIVSSFPGDGLITTSAKISHGNSGGLAISEAGCVIGVPSMVMGDEYESLGLITSINLVDIFYTETQAALKALKESKSQQPSQMHKTTKIYKQRL